MYLSSAQILKKLQLDSFFNDISDMKIEENFVVVRFRVGGFFCSLKIRDGIDRVINIEVHSDYSKKIMKELFSDYEKLNFYNIFTKNSKNIFYYFLIFNKFKINFYLNELCNVIKDIYLYMKDNALRMNSCFRVDNSIIEIKNTQIALDIRTNLSHKCLSMLETMELVFEKKLSISRYGDGELNLVCDIRKNTDFQKNSFEINYTLSDILKKKRENLLVCLPLISLAEPFWRNFWFNKWYLFSHHCELPMYGVAQVSRPIFFKLYKEEAVEAWKKIWRGKRVCFIYGKGSRFNINHILFDEIIYTQEILGKATNAFDELNILKAQAIEKKDNVDIYLIALGQTGTILAAELAEEGLWALDVGHLPNSYDNIFNSKATPENLPLIK